MDIEYHYRHIEKNFIVDGILGINFDAAVNYLHEMIGNEKLSNEDYKRLGALIISKIDQKEAMGLINDVGYNYGHIKEANLIIKGMFPDEEIVHGYSPTKPQEYSMWETIKSRIDNQPLGLSRGLYISEEAQKN